MKNPNRLKLNNRRVSKYMNCCSKRCINLVTLIIVILTFVQINVLTVMMIFHLKSNNIDAISTKETRIEKQEEDTQTQEWKLVIPKINVSANIQEGTSGEVINNYIGHFQETPLVNGNIGLIAASAGYKENYFERLEELQEGDVIIYILGNNKKEYKVTKNIEIEETDWSHLSSTNNNILTLITGILEKPESRRCVQAVEIQ